MMDSDLYVVRMCIYVYKCCTFGTTIVFLTCHYLLSQGSLHMDSSGDVHAFLKHNSFDTYLDAQLVELKGNMMTFSYQHQQPGEYQLHVQVCGKEINSSPFKVIMQQPFTFKGDFIRRFVGGELKQPWGVACTSNGNIAVVDHEGEKGVTIFDADGKMVSSFMEAMSLLNFWGPKGKCYRPSGIAVDCNDDILVVDGGMHRIQKFSKDGRLLKVVGSCGSGELQFREPVGIQVNAGSEVYVCDRRNDRIQVLDHFFAPSVAVVTRMVS